MPRLVRAVALLVCLLSVTSCDENSPVGPTVRLNERFTLARITLIDLQPYPFSSRTTAPGDYRATLMVTSP